MECDREYNKKGMLSYSHALRHLESSILPSLICLFFLFKGLGQGSVNAEMVTQEKNVTVVHLGIGVIQTACVATAA